MNQASVARHFYVSPSAAGSIEWDSDRTMHFDHVPLQPSKTYQVVLDPGYRDLNGQEANLRHSWQFTTEAPPELTGSSPSHGDRDVDPAAYIALTFSREMDSTSLPGAISLSPGLRFSLRRDPADLRRVILAPAFLLDPLQSYSVTVTATARDIDGNHLGWGSVVSFTSGNARGLQRWIGFVAEPPTGGGGSGVWIVDENRFPRQLVAAPVNSFTWSPDGTRLLVRSPTGAWSDQPAQGSSTVLPFQASWAAYLAQGHGYIYLDNRELRLLSSDGRTTLVASGVLEAAVAPGGTRIAYTVARPTGSEIRGYDIDPHTDYRLHSEIEPVDGLAWSPDGLSLAFRLRGGDQAKHQIRALLLRGAGSTVTVATGDVSGPLWQADSRHVFFRAQVRVSSGLVSKAFRLAPGDPPPNSLTAGLGMPSGADVSVGALSPSPDGHQIAFLSEAGGLDQVWLMNADGTGLTQLTDFDPDGFPYRCTEVAWTPS